MTLYLLLHCYIVKICLIMGIPAVITSDQGG